MAKKHHLWCYLYFEAILVLISCWRKEKYATNARMQSNNTFVLNSCIRGKKNTIYCVLIFSRPSLLYPYLKELIRADVTAVSLAWRYGSNASGCASIDQITFVEREVLGDKYDDIVKGIDHVF